MSDLKPCPFCGQRARMSKSLGGEAWWVDCRCGTKGTMTRTEAEAAAAWNHRSPDEALSRLLSAAREIRDIEREGGGSMDRVDEYRERWEAAIPALCEALEEVEACRI